MTAQTHGRLPYDAPLVAYEREAETLLVALEARDPAAEWWVKWQHPRFKGVTTFTRAIDSDERLRRFESAAEAGVSARPLRRALPAASLP